MKTVDLIWSGHVTVKSVTVRPDPPGQSVCGEASPTRLERHGKASPTRWECPWEDLTYHMASPTIR